MSIPWLYEEINKIQAVQLLKQNHEGDGSFLVRTNLIRDNEYVLYVYKKYFKAYFFIINLMKAAHFLIFFFLIGISCSYE